MWKSRGVKRELIRVFVFGLQMLFLRSLRMKRFLKVIETLRLFFPLRGLLRITNCEG